MKKTILVFASAAGLLLPEQMPAQGTIYLSNLAQPSGGSVAVASDSWLAQRFLTGTNLDGYALNSIQLLMNQASGSPSGFTVSLSTFNSGVPGSSLDSLSGLAPSTAGIFTYTASSVSLLPSTLYFIVVTATTPIAEGSYYWSKANASSFSSSDGWSLADFYSSSTDGSNWQLHRLFPLQFAVDATAVPEPGRYALAGLGLVWLSFWRRQPRPKVAH